MFQFKPMTLGLCVVGLLVASPGQAASSGASSASESVGASVGSLSASLQNSSASSTHANNLADGDYRLIEIAQAPGRSDAVRLTLQAAADASEQGRFFLTLPQPALLAARLGLGDVVTARHQVYGIEFADVRTRLPFFLVLTDDWYQELPSRAVPPSSG